MRDRVLHNRGDVHLHHARGHLPHVPHGHGDVHLRHARGHLPHGRDAHADQCHLMLALLLD